MVDMEINIQEELENKNLIYCDRAKLLLRNYVADVEDDECIESVSTTMNYAPIVEFNDGTKLIFDWIFLLKFAKELKVKDMLNEKEQSK